MNIVIPGLGAVVTATLYPEKTFKPLLIIGVLQFILLFIVVGWFWAIGWAIFLMRKSTDDIDEVEVTMFPSQVASPSAKPYKSMPKKQTPEGEPSSFTVADEENPTGLHSDEISARDRDAMHGGRPPLRAHPDDDIDDSRPPSAF